MASSFSRSLMITSLQSALTHAHIICKGDFNDFKVSSVTKCWMKIGRNLRPLLISLKKLDDEGELHIEELYPRLEYYIEKLNIFSDSTYHWTVEEVHYELKSMVDKLSNGGVNDQPCVQLEADEILSIINCVVVNTADFLSGLAVVLTGDSFDALETYLVQAKFIKHLLRFALKSSVEVQNSLLPHITPIATNAASVFALDTEYRHIQKFFGWFKEIESKCWAVALTTGAGEVLSDWASDDDVLRRFSAATDEIGGNDTVKALLDSFISLLWDLLRHQSESCARDHARVLYERLRLSRAFLQKISVDENMMGQFGVLMCDAGAFIFLLNQTDPGRFEDLLERFDVFQAHFELETIPSSNADHVDQVSTDDSTSTNVSDDGKGRDLEISSHQHPQNSPSQVVGFKEDEFQSLLDRLKHGTTNYLRIVPICGMAGLGKTTLALKLFNHPSVMDHFQARAWCPISQVLDKKKVLTQLLSQILPGDYTNETEEDLADMLRRSLKGKRYLILLDDIWSAHVWDRLKASFPDDSTSSRIIFTSRCLDIVPHTQPEGQPHMLRLRSDTECFEILQTNVSHKQSWSTEVTELVKEIAERCNGLPLTVIIVAGLLATSEQESWKGILDHLSSGSVSGRGRAGSALELSYRHLPDYLQPCFLYFGAFPEDAEVPVKSLIRLWMAEGFVRKRDQSKRIEDVAREYVEKLIERSLVMAVESRSIGGVSSCRIHDVVHDFCRSKAKQENLFHLLLQEHDQLSDFNEPCNLQRLFIHSSANHFKETELFCPRAQSILFFNAEWESQLWDMAFISQVFCTLKVLDVSQIFFLVPSGIQLLTQLRYLAIRAYLRDDDLGNLSNLETLILHIPRGDSGSYSFPDTLWNLKKLRCLHVRGCFLTLPIENLDNSSCLLELETLDGVCFDAEDGSMEKLLKKFPNVRNLKCSILRPEGTGKNVIPEFLSQLLSLSIQGNGGVNFELSSSAENLRKLKLKGVQLSRQGIAVIGRFPKLEVLILFDILYLEGQLEMQEEEFTKLRILKLISSESLERWTCSDDQAFFLEKLVFKYCENLEEIPSSWLEGIETLEQIEVHYCSSALESAVRNIEEVQKDYGNRVQVVIQK